MIDESTDPTTEEPGVRITAPTPEQFEAVHEALGDDTIWRLAATARRCDVMITLTIAPYAPEEAS